MPTFQAAAAAAAAAAGAGAGAAAAAASTDVKAIEFPKCHTCSKPASMKCSRCKTARYCSKECQQTDWQAHKPVCHPPPVQFMRDAVNPKIMYAMPAGTSPAKAVTPDTSISVIAKFVPWLLKRVPSTLFHIHQYGMANGFGKDVAIVADFCQPNVPVLRRVAITEPNVPVSLSAVAINGRTQAALIKEEKFEPTTALVISEHKGAKVPLHFMAVFRVPWSVIVATRPGEMDFALPLPARGFLPGTQKDVADVCEFWTHVLTQYAGEADAMVNAAKVSNVAKKAARGKHA